MLKYFASNKCLPPPPALPFASLIFGGFSTSREEYIEKVRGAAKKSRNPYLSVIWSEGGAQPALEGATGLTFGYPAVIAVSVEKKASYQMSISQVEGLNCCVPVPFFFFFLRVVVVFYYSLSVLLLLLLWVGVGVSISLLCKPVLASTEACTVCLHAFSCVSRADSIAQNAENFTSSGFARNNSILRFLCGLALCSFSFSTL